MSKSTSTHRRLFWLLFFAVTGGLILKACILSPLYIYFVSDVVYQDRWWVEVLYHLTDGGLIDLAVFAVCYPITLYAIRREGLKAAKSLPITFTVVTFLKFVANFLMNALTDGALPDMEEFLTTDLPMILAMFGMEIAQYLLVVLVAVLVRWLYNRRVDIAEGMKLLPRNRREDYPLPPDDFPFVKLYARRNALQRGALWTAVIVTLGRVINHFVYQVTLYTYFGSSEGWVVMLVDLVGDIMIGVCFYFISLLLMMHFHRKEKG